VSSLSTHAAVCGAPLTRGAGPATTRAAGPITRSAAVGVAAHLIRTKADPAEGAADSIIRNAAAVAVEPLTRGALSLWRRWRWRRRRRWRWRCRRRWRWRLPRGDVAWLLGPGHPRNRSQQATHKSCTNPLERIVPGEVAVSQPFSQLVEGVFCCRLPFGRRAGLLGPVLVRVFFHSFSSPFRRSPDPRWWIASLGMHPSRRLLAGS
jgi:hypothetical protein